MAMQIKQMMSVADYLAWEEWQELKHEYIDREIIEMTGGTSEHSIIKVNILFSLRIRVSRQDFTIYNSDMRIQATESRYVYPDASVVRGLAQFTDDSKLTLLNPVFVVEVTSPSSARRDRIDKLDYYFAVPSIEAYLIIDQDRVHAELYTRAADGWRSREFSSRDDVMPLAALNCELPLAQVYLDICIDEA